MGDAVAAVPGERPRRDAIGLRDVFPHICSLSTKHRVGLKKAPEVAENSRGKAIPPEKTRDEESRAGPHGDERRWGHQGGFLRAYYLS